MLQDVAGRALDAALGAGAEAAEAYAEDSTKREVRVFGGEVESLTEAGERGVGVRSWIGGRVGYAYGTDISAEGLRRLGADSAEAARIADPDEFAVPPEANGAAPEIEGLADPSVGEWTTERKVELAKAVESVARQADERIEAIETTVYVDEEASAALASSTGLAGAYEATACYAYLQAIAAAGGDRQTGLGFGMGRGPDDLDAEADRPRGGRSRHLPSRSDEARLAKLPGRPRRDRGRELLRVHRRRAVRRRHPARALAVRRAPGGGDRRRQPSPSPTTAPTRRASRPRRSTARAPRGGARL